MKNTALFLHNLNIYLFLWHYPFKGLCKSCKKWPSTLRMQYIKSDSAQYHTVQSQSWKTRITLRNLYKNRKYFNPFVAKVDSNYEKKVENLVYLILLGAPEKYEYLGKNETILTQWSVAQAGLNDEKNWGRKSRWTVPLRLVSGPT